MNLNTEPNEQIDTLHLNGYKIIQNKNGFMFGVDAVLLAHFASSIIRKNDHVIDLGTGNGIIPILLAAQSTAKEITGIEYQEISANLATRSIQLNNLSDKIHIVQGNVAEIQKHFASRSADVVVSNPPYIPTFASGTTTQNPAHSPNKTESLSLARHEISATLQDFVRAASFILKPHGKFCLIHRPNRLSEIFAALHSEGLEPKRMQFIHPLSDRPPTMVLIEARKDAKPDLSILPPLVMYDRPQVRSQALEAIYRAP